MERVQTVEAILRAGAVAVLRMKDAHKVLRVCGAIAEGGVRAVEITMTVPDALAVLRQVVREMGDALLVGVGTVLDARTASAAVQAGARFVVSPVFKDEILRTAREAGVPAIPGAFSPTEIQEAYEAGADIVKVFPADILGMQYFRAIRAPLPHLRLMPTGGVTCENAGEWIRAGACAVGIGTALLDTKAIDAGDFAMLTGKARILTAGIAQARSVTRAGA